MWGESQEQRSIMTYKLLFALSLFAVLAPATPVYRIDFSGVITGGTLKASLVSELSSIDIPFTPGGQIHGSIFADFSNNPLPSQNDSTGVHWNVPVTARIQFELPDLPNGILLPIPDNLVIEQSFGTTLQLQFATNAQVVFPRFTFSEPPPGNRNYRNEGFFFAFLGPGSGIHLPNGALYPAFAATNLDGTGGLRVLKVDQTINSQPPLFGLTEFYDIEVNFVARDAQGGFVVPEPGTGVFLGIALAGLVAARRSGASRR
jgi:hypothetical protein